MQGFPDWDPRSWSEPYRDPPTQPLPQPPRFDTTDPLTPLFDAVWALSGLSGRHARTPDGRPPMGRHDDLDGDGLADQAAELPHDDGVEPDEPYTVIHPDQFEEG